MKPCKCSNKGVISTLKFCPYCGGKLFVKPPKRYPVENGRGTGSYAINTRVKRCPKKGEYYLSGAVVMAYKAPNDLSTEFLIAEIISV